MLFNLFQIGPIPSNAITGSYYNYHLVALSYCIAVLASYVALDMAGRLRAEKEKWTKLYWLLGGAIAMGAGIWSMHFIGMLAFIMPVEMDYDIFWTGFSLFVAIVASGFALFLLRKERPRLIYMIFGGILLGIGIASMHYTGMHGMTGVDIHYLPGLFFLSIAIAIFASEAALWLALQSNWGSFRRQLYSKIASAFVMGAAICGMHYTGMAAAVFIPTEPMSMGNPSIPSYGLAFYIAGITLVIISFALSTSTYKQLMASAAKKEKDFLNAILDHLEDGIVACNAKGKITVLNQAMQKMLGLSKEENLVNNWTDYCKFSYLDQTTLLPADQQPLVLALKGEHISATELVLITKNKQQRNIIVEGQPIISDEREKIGAVIAIHDITERKQMESQLIRQATHDILTDLPNRMLLLDRIEQAILLEKRLNKKIAVLFIDIDHFKLINDNFGHSVGDDLLLIVSKRLQNSVRQNDTIARLSGDEFVVLLSSVEDEENIIAIAQKILVKLSEPFQIKEHKSKITVSIGISSFPKNGEDPDTLLKNADTAMYRVKAQGRNNFKFYSEDMNIRTIKRLELEQNLYNALEDKQYILYYQPIVDLHKGYISGFEALLRWQHPRLGLLLPIDFISLLEETNLIIPIGEWVLKTACAQNKAWQDAGLTPLRISVNVSGKQLNESNFLATVKDVLNQTQLLPKYLDLEITESSILERPAESLNTLSSLKKLGVHIALDDFGIGYSSLGYLSRLPIDKLKIDRSFVQNISDHSENAAIILAIIGMASSMKLKVTAEGMETQSELAFLRIHHCDEVQGYYFSKPLTAEDATNLLRQNPQLLINSIT